LKATEKKLQANFSKPFNTLCKLDHLANNANDAEHSDHAGSVSVKLNGELAQTNMTGMITQINFANDNK